MRLEEYDRIIERHRQLKPRESLSVLIKEYPHVDASALRSIIAVDYVKWVRRNYHSFSQADQTSRYYEDFKALRETHTETGFLLKYTDNVGLAPSLVCRFIIERFLKESGEPHSKPRLTKCLKDTSLLSDPVLALEVYLCTLQDAYYGPYSDARRQTRGLEYELKLQDDLESRGIGFVDENILRESGYDKTPDIKLEVPVVINGDTIITWIESKASFGDPDSHDSYLKEQYQSYANRFGPGLVIYWYGFVNELPEVPNIYLSDHLPEDMRSMKYFIT